MFTEDICVLELDLSNINYRNICAINKKMIICSLLSTSRASGIGGSLINDRAGMGEKGTIIITIENKKSSVTCYFIELPTTLF